MASAKLDIYQLNITENLRIDVYENSNLAAIVQQAYFTAPHPTTRNVQIDNLNSGMHTFKCYKTTAIGVLGTLICQYTHDVRGNDDVKIEFIEFRVGAGRGAPHYDPAEGDTAWNNPDIAGYNLISIQRSLGPRREQDEITVLTTGGFEFQTAETFTADDTWHVVVAKPILVPISSSGFLKGIEDVSADLTINNANLTDYNNKMLRFTGSSTIRRLIFDDLSIFPNNSILALNTESFAGRYVSIEISSGSINFMGSSRTQIWMGKNEQLLLVMKAGVAEVVSKEGDFARVGEIVKTEIQPANSISETAGQWVNITDYPRLFYFYVNLLPLSYLSTFTGSTVDEPTKWAIDSVNGKFWIPDTGGYFERNQDPTNNVDTDRNSTTNKPGAVQQDELKSHKHVESIGFINSNGTPPIVRTVGTYNGTGTGTPDYTDFVGGSETRAKNVVRMVWRII